MKDSLGPYGLIKGLTVVFIFGLIFIIALLPKLSDRTVFDPPVSYYANVYQEMYPTSVTILDRQQDVKSYEIVFSTSASKDTVFAWYDTQYPAHGWTHILLYGSPEQESMYRFWDYVIDECRSLGLTVEYNQQNNTYLHIIVLTEGRMCRVIK